MCYSFIFPVQFLKKKRALYSPSHHTMNENIRIYPIIKIAWLPRMVSLDPQISFKGFSANVLLWIQGLFSSVICPGLVMTNLTYGILPSFFWTLIMPFMWLVSENACPSDIAKALQQGFTKWGLSTPRCLVVPYFSILGISTLSVLYILAKYSMKPLSLLQLTILKSFIIHWTVTFFVIIVLVLYFSSLSLKGYKNWSADCQL